VSANDTWSTSSGSGISDWYAILRAWVSMKPPDTPDEGVMRIDIPWPFPNDQFPDDLGAVVMNSVLDGRRPALQIVHFETGSWGVADAIDRPKVRNMTATHLRHVLDRDPTLAELATMQPGYQADRNAVGDPWVISLNRDDPGILDRLRAHFDIVRFGGAEAKRRFEDRFGPR
jgi:hypothetical protein